MTDFKISCSNLQFNRMKKKKDMTISIEAKKLQNLKPIIIKFLSQLKIGDNVLNLMKHIIQFHFI